jgi:hypothetical protein
LARATSPNTARTEPWQIHPNEKGTLVSSIAPPSGNCPITPPPPVDLAAFMEAVRKNPPTIVALCGSTQFASPRTTAAPSTGRVAPHESKVRPS